MALYQFGPFEFDSGTGELLREGSPVHLRPQPARALARLLERHGALVSRLELQRTIWTDGTYVHYDHGLNSCMKQIRAALGDSRTSPRFIETLVRRGFRFVAPVVVVSARGDADGGRRTRIRVLTVRTLGHEDAATRGVADGLGEEVLTQLTAVSPADVAVIAPAMLDTSAAFDTEPGADYFLATTMRGGGSARLRVTSQLIDADTNCHVWAGRFDVPLDRPLDAQIAIARAVAREVITALGREYQDHEPQAVFEPASAVQSPG